MAKKPVIRPIVEEIGVLLERLQICPEVAVALIETGQSLTGAGNPARQTEFDRFRSTVLDSVDSLISRLNDVRHDKLRPDIVRTIAHLRKIDDSCRKCGDKNTWNLRDGRPFACSCVELVRRSEQHEFRYTLDEHGRINTLQ